MQLTFWYSENLLFFSIKNPNKNFVISSKFRTFATQIV